LNFLVDENMPRSLASQIAALGFSVQDVRDIGLRGHPDTEVMEAAISADAIIITRDRGLADPKSWPEAFTAGVIFINLPDDTSAGAVNAKILEVLANRLPVSLLGAFTTIESRRALSRRFRRRISTVFLKPEFISTPASECIIRSAILCVGVAPVGAGFANGRSHKLSPSTLNANHLLQSRHNLHQIRLLVHHLIDRLISARNFI